MEITKELIYEILRIVEDVVEEATTERVLFGYKDDDKLTEEGERAYERIVTAFRVAEIKRGQYYEQQEHENTSFDGASAFARWLDLHLYGDVLHIPEPGPDNTGAARHTSGRPIA